MHTEPKVERKPLPKPVRLSPIVPLVEFVQNNGLILVGIALILMPFLLTGVSSLAIMAEDNEWASAPFFIALQSSLPNIPLMVQIIIFALYGIAFNMALGAAGVLSLGHCAFFGVGSYAAGLLLVWVKEGTPVPEAITHFFLLAPIEFAFTASIIATLAVAIGIGALCQRKLGVYFAIVTLAISQILYYVVQTFDTLTGGTDGLAGVENVRLGLLGIELGVTSATNTYWFVFIVAAICVLIMRKILKSSYGRVLNAIRENENRAQTCGYNTQRVKLTAFVLSALFSGIAGFLAIIYGEAVPIENIHWSTSGTAVIITLFGGSGTFLGPAIGSFIYWYLRQLMSTQFVAIWSGFQYWEAWVGGIFILIVLFLPDGVLGTIGRLATNWTQRKRLEAEDLLADASAEENSS